MDGKRLDVLAIACFKGLALRLPKQPLECPTSAVPATPELRLQALRIAGVGGDRIIPSQLQSFADRYAETDFHVNAFRPSYGLAETTLAVTVCELPWARAHRRFIVNSASGVADAEGAVSCAQDFVSCGRPLPGWRLTVRDERGAALPAGIVGDVMVYGAAQMSGIYDACQPSIAGARDRRCHERHGFSRCRGRSVHHGPQEGRHDRARQECLATGYRTGGGRTPVFGDG
ncbi:AMP-binding protein [Ottowia thiooxydans]|uniref:Acyl-CoA synthetase (AMP-forming)/AMP-acid ligase II n=1 Tax=Ottowia thiooxydans TaxID=219182 RepID=A0ABV2Q6W2_9BURK